MKVFVATTVAAVMLFGAPVKCVLAQSAGLRGTLLPLTNQLGFTNGAGFTNTLVQVTNLSSLQLSNVVTLLLTLQTNVEELLPVLSDITSNATFAAPPGTPQIQGPIAPFMSNPTGAIASPLTPSSTAATARTNLFSITIGTNVFDIDPPTFQALIIVRDNLQQTLPVLQMLNGAAPSATNPATPPAFTNTTPPLTALPFLPLTNSTGLPLTNQSHIVSNPNPF